MATWVAADEFADLLGNRADAGLTDELMELVPDSTDELDHFGELGEP